MADRAVSDVVGFVLVASLVAVSVGVVYVGGMSALADARQAEQVNNAERAIEVFAANVEDVSRDGAPSRGTEIQLGDARLGFGDPVQFNVSLGTGESYSATVQPVVYDTGDTQIRYVNGAIIREQGTGAVLLREPGFSLGERTVVPYVVTRAPEGSEVAGSGRVLLRTSATRRTVQSYTTPPGGQYDVTLNVTAPRPAVWQRHFDRKPGVDCVRAGETVSCSFESSRVYVQVVQVDLAVR